MAVFNPNPVNLTPGYEDIMSVLQQRAALESKRPSIYDIGTNAFNVVKQVGDENRAEARDVRKEDRAFAKQQALEKQKADQEMVQAKYKSEMDKELADINIKGDLNKQKQLEEYQGQQKALERYHEKRGEAYFSETKTRDFEKQLGLEPGTLDNWIGTSIPLDDLNKLMKGVTERVAQQHLADIQMEPNAGDTVTNIPLGPKGSKPVTFGQTREGATQGKRLKKESLMSMDPGNAANAALAQNGLATGKTTGTGGTSDRAIKAALQQKFMTVGEAGFTPEEKQLFDTLFPNPYIKQAMGLQRLNGLNNMTKDPDQIEADTLAIAQRLQQRDQQTAGGNQGPGNEAFIAAQAAHAAQAIKSGYSAQDVLDGLKTDPRTAPYADRIMQAAGAKKGK
jgi:hypothetical protein